MSIIFDGNIALSIGGESSPEPLSDEHPVNKTTNIARPKKEVLEYLRNRKLINLIKISQTILFISN
jgi:hypothetical protein